MRSNDNAEMQRTLRCRRGTPHPPVFCKKRLQVIENNGLEFGKEGQERKRVRK